MGDVKEIRPAAISDTGTGDSTADLGWHVDGTQHDETPRFLVFQYVTAAKHGGRSIFVDGSGALASLNDEDRLDVIRAFGSRTAASFSKGTLSYDGPMLFRNEDNQAGFRTRYDNVVTVADPVRSTWQKFGRLLEDPSLKLDFIPHEGDIVVFDNWRLFHAREEVHGQRQRHHRRVWINTPGLRLDGLPFGVRLTQQEKELLPIVSAGAA